MRTLQRAIGQRLSLLAIWLLCQLAAAVASAWMLLAIIASSSGRRAWTLAVSYDQLANAAFGGHEDETISSRAGKAAREGKRWACVLCRLLDRFDPNHCEKSIELDRGKAMR
ncbi:hypothetical protein Tther_02247 [Tepidimonas thermarum]|uniref:Uncharacterized protein n=1 Tax=Tepidimonas thermarum TaxID=335431 RepID=A0A554WXE6_9BURK|nr:hypothetical protein [Tepidimonas thermarum]TSE28246.1 hypothetical protein Tther_02247 [Tepidimonas thermarum]